MPHDARVLVVRLDAGLETYRINGIAHGIATRYPGVASVFNASMLSQDELTALLFPTEQPSPAPKKHRRKSKAAATVSYAGAKL